MAVCTGDSRCPRPIRRVCRSINPCSECHHHLSSMCSYVFPKEMEFIMATSKPNIVLVHGAWADGSCWSAVIEGLQIKGYNVTAPQFPESSLEADVTRLRQVLNRQDGPTVSLDIPTVGRS